MPDLTLNVDPKTSGYAYRPLRLLSPIQRGADVFALQTGLLEFLGESWRTTAGGYFATPVALVPDGALGRITDAAIYDFQTRAGLSPVDRIAGINTQRRLGDLVSRAARDAYQLPNGAMYGQLEHECGWELGNFTGRYPDGSYDRGAAQENSRNSKYGSDQDAFDLVKCTLALAAAIRNAHDLYAARGDQGLSDSRRWDLAQGSWNRPAWAAWEAGVRDSGYATRPTTEQAQQLDAYIAAVTAYRTSP